MSAVPAFMLKKLYVHGSLKNTAEGFELAIKNTLAPGTIIGLGPLKVDGREVARENIQVSSGSGSVVRASTITAQAPVTFQVNALAILRIAGEKLTAGSHEIIVTINTKEVGLLQIPITDTIAG
jgi:hypothetical protein